MTVGHGDMEGREIRCPRLGGEVTFAYCRRESGDLPCRRILSCWETMLPVREVLADLPPDVWRHLAGPQPMDRLSTLLQATHQARGRKGP